jgi:hypothetical protein
MNKQLDPIGVSQATLWKDQWIDPVSDLRVSVEASHGRVRFRLRRAVGAIALNGGKIPWRSYLF